MARTPTAAGEQSTVPSPRPQLPQDDGVAAPVPTPAKRSEPTGDERLTREQESREYDAIHTEWDDVDWRSPRLLDAPQALPNMDQRWVATMADGTSDPQNVARRMNEGWRPRPAESAPPGYTPPTIQHGEFAGAIGIVGMVLMHRPTKISKRFAGKVRDDTERQMSAVNAALGQTHKPGDPFKRPTLEGKATVERGRRPIVADDDD